MGRSRISFRVCPNPHSCFPGPGSGNTKHPVCVCVCGVPSMIICMEQHQPHRHRAGSPLPKAEELQGNHSCSSPSKPTQDRWKSRASFLPLLNEHAGSMEHTQGHTRLDEEVGGGCQLEVSKKPEARFLFITRK